MLSKVAAKMYFPLGLNLTKDTGGLSSSKRKEKIINNRGKIQSGTS